MRIPLASAVCCTYGRPSLLREAIQCFVDQDYPNKELIVLNDLVETPMSVVLDDPRIRVVNHPERFPSLGDKREFGKSLANGDYYLVWDDDDLSLPWRISESISYLESNPALDAVNPLTTLMSTDNKEWTTLSSNTEGQACFAMRWARERRYPEGKNLYQDLMFQNGARIGRPEVSPEYWYVYRWGCDVYHLSDLDVECEEVWEESGRMGRSSGGNGIVRPGFNQDHWGNATRFLKGLLAPIEFERWLSRIRRYL